MKQTLFDAAGIIAAVGLVAGLACWHAKLPPFSPVDAAELESIQPVITRAAATDNLMVAILQCRSGDKGACALARNTFAALAEIGKSITLCAKWDGGEHCVEASNGD